MANDEGKIEINNDITALYVHAVYSLIKCFVGWRMLLASDTIGKLFIHSRKKSSAICQFIWNNLDHIFGVHETKRTPTISTSAQYCRI